jgi:hypothetical protein
MKRNIPPRNWTIRLEKSTGPECSFHSSATRERVFGPLLSRGEFPAAASIRFHSPPPARRSSSAPPSPLLLSFHIYLKIYFLYMDLWIIIVWVFNMSCLSIIHSILFLLVPLLNQTRHEAASFYFHSATKQNQNDFVLSTKRGAEPFRRYHKYPSGPGAH